MSEETTCCPERKWVKILAILCLTAIVVVAILRDRIVSQTNWTVQVTGVGEISYEPDYANLVLGVAISNEKNPTKAIADMNTTTKKIIDSVTKLGIPADKFKTTNFNLMPHYVYLEEKTEVTGYDAEQMLTIKIEGIDQNKELLGKAIEAASSVGANKVSGIEFNSSKIESLKQEARVIALKDARSKAGSIANAAGVKIGKVVGWWENMVYMDNLGKGGYAPEAMAVDTSPSGQQKVKIEMNVNYLVK